MGHLLLGLCLVTLLAAAGAVAFGLRGAARERRATRRAPGAAAGSSAAWTGSRQRALAWGLGGVYVALLLVFVASAILLTALLTGDTSFRYVVENWDSSLPSLYRVSAFWAGQQGSFLLWTLLLLGAGSLVAVRGARSQRELRAGAAVVLALVGAFLVLLMLVDRGSDPFAAAPAGAAPAGLNPLLLHPAMALHPPALFVGYVGLAVSFAYAVSALWLRRLDAAWTHVAQRWALVGWVFLSIGIGLGAWWAYVILSWGGYWGWDAVENTSLIPWLTATALLHTFSVYGRAPMFRRWAVSLAVLTFWFTILATWTTRTGLVQSLHAFSRQSTLVVALSLALGIVAAAGVWLIARRWTLLAAPDGRERVVTLGARDVMHEVADVVLTAFAAAIALAAVLVPVAFDRSVQAGTYETLARPLGVAIVALLAVCPLVWTGGAPTVQSVARRFAAPLGVAALTALALGLRGWAGSVGGLVSLAVAAFAGAAALEWLLIRARAGGRGRAPSVARTGGRTGATTRTAGHAGATTRAGGGAFTVGGLVRALTRSRRATGGLVAHLGMALILVGLVGTSLYAVRGSISIPAKTGASASVGGYTLSFSRYRGETAPQGGQRVAAALTVSRGGHVLGTVEPSLDIYAGTNETVARAAILGGVWRDLFVSPRSYSAQRLSADVIVFPLIRFLWAGVVLLVAGGAVALLPRRAPAIVPAADESPARVRTGGEPLIGDSAADESGPAGSAAEAALLDRPVAGADPAGQSAGEPPVNPPEGERAPL